MRNQFEKPNFELKPYLILVPLVLVVITLIANGKIDNSENSRDWIMLLINFVTAVFLIKTFIEQQKLTRIEQSRYLEEIRPQPKVLIDNYKLKVSFTNNEARYVRMVIEHSSNYEFDVDSGQLVFPFVPIENELTFPPTISPDNSNDHKSPKTYFKVTLYYSDKHNNHYEQFFESKMHKQLIPFPTKSIKKSGFFI
ncbi:hypothetical protein [Sphingobacterium sp.]|uniref:hypothetical protein n=1 Tax=Sphingobacterium sp. TaxID=341027 RepID=UPI0028A6427B|nr:hypothetical protein [Sphingobacterium sp.]